MKMISLSNRCSPNLTTRKMAAELRTELIAIKGEVVLDFKGIKLMSHSFCDEVFGRLAEQFGLDVFRDRFHLVNLSEDDRVMLRAVVSDRLQAKAS